MSEPDFDVEAMKAQLEERYRSNAAMLGAGDVIVACVPGSGSSLLSTLILELGFEHLDQYFNVLQEDGKAEVDPFFKTMRSRLSGYAEVDSGTKQAVDQRARFYRCHLTPEGFDLGALHGVVLLVRDPRDARRGARRGRGAAGHRLRPRLAVVVGAAVRRAAVGRGDLPVGRCRSAGGDRRPPGVDGRGARPVHRVAPSGPWCEFDHPGDIDVGLGVLAELDGLWDERVS